MISRAWSFERAARKLVQAEVAASRTLWKEHRLARSASQRRRRISPQIYRFFTIAAVVTQLLFARLYTVDFIVAFVLLWTVGMTCFRASQLNALLQYDSAVIVFDHLPIPDNDIFRFQWQRLLRGSWWLLFDFTAAYSLLLAHAGGAWNALIGGAALAVVQCLFIVAMAVCVATYVRPRYYLNVMWPVLLGAFFLLFGGSSQPRLCAWISGMAGWVPPSGWIVQSLGIAENNSLLQQILSALMCAIVLALAPLAFRRLRSKFALAMPAHATDGRSAELIEFGVRRAKAPDDAGSAIRRRQFLNGFDWQKARVVERLVSRLLTSREKDVAEFITAAQPGWTKWMRGLLILVIIGLAIHLAFAARLAPALGSCGFYLVVFWVLTVVNQWRGFALPKGTGLRSPIYAVYPLSYWELTRTVTKVNLAMYLMSMPLILGTALILAQDIQPVQGHTLGIALKMIALGLIAQPFMAFGPISPNTDDTQKIGNLLSAASFVLSLAASAITFFFVWNPVVMLIAGLVGLALSVWALVLYGRWFDTGRFDLVPMKPPEGTSGN